MDVPILFAFTAGTVAAFNPCGAAMFPAYVGFQLSRSSNSLSPLLMILRGLFTGIILTLGFVAVFGIFGILMSLGVRLVGSFLPFIGLSVGLLTLIVGIWLLLLGRNLSLPQLSSISFGSLSGTNHIFLFGIAYALASLSCALPVFLSAVGIVIGSGISAKGMANVVVGSIAYSLGMGLIMTLVTVAVLYFEDATQRLMGILIPHLETLGKASMVAAGGYIVFYWLFGDGSELFRSRLGIL